MKKRILLILIFLLTCSDLKPQAVKAYFQESTPIVLKISRELGFGLGGQIQGTFSLKASGPDDLDRVEFYVDDQLIGEDRSPPFSVKFNTGNYERGVHQLLAVGHTPDGRELQSNRISRQFVSVLSVVLVVGAVIALVVAFRIASSYIARGKGSKPEKGFGYLGGTICPNCGRSYGIHWWSLRLGFGRLDRCPHCGKWKMISRSSADALAEVDRLERDPELVDSAETEQQSQDDERLRRQLDESRYSDK